MPGLSVETVPGGALASPRSPQRPFLPSGFNARTVRLLTRTIPAGFSPRTFAPPPRLACYQTRRCGINAPVRRLRLPDSGASCPVRSTLLPQPLALWAGAFSGLNPLPDAHPNRSWKSLPPPALPSGVSPSGSNAPCGVGFQEAVRPTRPISLRSLEAGLL